MEQASHTLNEYYANLIVLDHNLRNLYLNVVGNSFFGLHKKIKEYDAVVLTFVEEVGLRIRMLRGYPLTSLPKIEEVSTFKSMCSMDFTGGQVFEVLQNDFHFICEYAKDLVEHFGSEKDLFTYEMLTKQVCYFEKELWMIETNLK